MTAVAVIGCGWAGRHHAAAYAAAGARLAWLIDRDATRAGQLAACRAGARSTTDISAALADPEVDAVSVCTPHHAHAQTVRVALEAGKHVLCEKPLAPDIGAADELIQAADAAGCALLVVDNQAHDPAYHQIARLVADGAVGRIAVAEVHREADLGAEFRTRRRDFLAPGGGILLSGAIHDVGTLRRLLGDVTGATALSPPNRIADMAGADTAVALLRFTGGAVAVLVESFATRAPETRGTAEIHTLRLSGSRGVVELSAQRELRVVTAHGETRTTIPEDGVYTAVIHDFLGRVCSGAASTAQARDHRDTLAVVLALGASAAGHSQ
ncbi:MAG: Gfo/Idh/MocA family oxidoreductase [Streptosporangiaceae bacterium]